MVGHSPLVDLTSTMASLFLKVKEERVKSRTEEFLRKDRVVALGHLAVSCFCPKNPSSLLQPTEGSKDQQCYLTSWAVTQNPQSQITPFFHEKKENIPGGVGFT